MSTATSAGSTAVARKINEYQDRHGTPTAVLARKVGVSRVTAYTWVRGEHLPRAHYLQKLAEVLGCDVAELVD